MSNVVVLNNKEHKNVKILTKRSNELGDNVMFTLTFPFEFRSVQAHYPIFFRKDPETQELTNIALFGFESKENLFITESGWEASYIPVTVQRDPFLIGLKKGDNSADPDRIMQIDLDSPRVSQTEGEPLFDGLGMNSDYLNRMAGMLEAIHQGHLQGKMFIQTLEQHDLLEPVTLDVTLDNGSTSQLIGFMTINEEKLRELDAAVLHDFNKRGYLEAIYMILASLSNISALAKRKSIKQQQDAQMTL